MRRKGWHPYWFLLGVIIGLAFIFAFCTPNAAKAAPADHNGPFLPSLPTAVQRAIEQRGYGLYKLNAAASDYPNFREQTWKFYAQECSFAGLCMYEVPSDQPADLVWQMDSASEWTYGSGIAGITWYWQQPVLVEMNQSLLYYYWDSTIAHEDGHAIAGEHEEYTDSNGKLVCKVVDWTRMSCGYPYIAVVTPWDRDVIWNQFIPDLPSQGYVTKDGPWLWVVYNGIRAASAGCKFPTYPPTVSCGGHYTPYLDNVTRVAVFYRDVGGVWQFTGFYGPPPGATGGLASRGFALTDWCAGHLGREWAVHPENALQISWPTFAGGAGFLSGDLLNVGSC